MRNSIIRYLLLSILACFISMNSLAQTSSTGDKRFKEGVELMKKGEYKSAITAFQNAKVAYTSKEKQKACNAKIAECNKKIGSKPRGFRGSKGHKGGDGDGKCPEGGTPITQQPIVVEPTMTFDPIGLEFDYKAKKRQELKITSNLGWTVVSKPDWVTLDIGSGGIMVKAEKYDDTENDRTDDIVFSCGGKKFIVKVSQTKNTKFIKRLGKKTKDAINRIFH